MTIDKRRRAAKPGELPAFTPVPRAYQRHDGWTDERQQNFIAALADTGSVKAAAHRVNMTPEGAYLLRRHPEAASFRAAWEAALALGVQQLEDIAPHPICAANRHFGSRALYGQEVPVYSYGKLIGSRVVHNDRLLMFMLRNRAPTRFTADGRVAARQSSIADPLKANKLSRLKKQWRKEWDEDRATETAAAAERQRRAFQGDSLGAQLCLMHQRWFTSLGPAARLAYRQFRAAEADSQEQERARDARWLPTDLEIAREDLEAATDPDDREDARQALAEAEAASTSLQSQLQQAEAEYAEWFTRDDRPKVWRAIDMVFSTALHAVYEELDAIAQETKP